MDCGEEYILFPTPLDKRTEENGKGPPEDLAINKISMNFEAKKKSAKINSFMVNSKYTARKTIFVLVFGILVITIMNFAINNFGRVSKDIIDSRTIEFLGTMGAQASIHVTFMLKKAVFFSNLLSQILSAPSILEMTKDNAGNVVKMLDSARASSDDNIFWWDLALEDGNYFSLSSDQRENMKTVSYGEMSTKTSDSFNYVWLINMTSEIPPRGYPDSNYSSVENDWTTFNQPWYQYVKQNNKSSWISPYIDFWGDIPLILISYAVPIYDGPNFTGTTSHTITLQKLKSELVNLSPSANSRLALLDQSDNLVVSTSADLGLGISNNTLFANGLSSINDPVWRCVYNYNISTQSHEGEYLCNVNGRKLTYRMNKINLLMNKEIQWSIIGAICQNDFTDEMNNSVRRFTVSFNILIEFVFVIIGVFLMVRNTAVIHFQNSNLQTENPKSDILDDLEEIISNITDPNINNEIINIYQDLISTDNTLKYDYHRMLANIKDTYVRYEVIEKFTPEFITDVPILSFRRRDAAEKLIFPGRFLVDYVVPRQHVKENMHGTIIQMFVTINNDALFDSQKLQQVLSNVMEQLPSSSIVLMADSFNLLLFLITNGIPPILNNHDKVFCMMFLTFVFHVSMARKKKFGNIEEKYSLFECEEVYSFVEMLLDNFNAIKLDSVGYDFKRWKKITNQIISFLPALFLEEQLTLPKKFLFNIKNRSGTLTVNEENLFCSILIIISQYSYFLIDNETSNNLISLIRNPFLFPIEDHMTHERLIVKSILKPCFEAIHTVILPSVTEPILP
ncbi:hypothetical protein TVAG_169850 [Trichomonas vaginalis G3]|uniref:Cache domain-containing protein n=1 Tax=Trichomonas vaginalis (strain ATCC PRA-98 / G3) TaxID=412133 RepID=A2DPC9_TRIV3|nr:PAS domain domain-containing protein [Trichomonas vaginalis G3]EAY17673.1 hypothetical protein TVAG_169850 [Trichomonas vaginalis G3]KAI5507923.1 PAS domain domain-containing protein [Trichomonas vaginalis G3]|eukprot:XP_001329808.1 hypothetical protein [Trichomonas vaginalis G3]